MEGNFKDLKNLNFHIFYTFCWYESMRLGNGNKTSKYIYLFSLWLIIRINISFTHFYKFYIICQKLQFLI